MNFVEDIELHLCVKFEPIKLKFKSYFSDLSVDWSRRLESDWNLWFLDFPFDLQTDLNFKLWTLLKKSRSQFMEIFNWFCVGFSRFYVCFYLRLDTDSFMS